MLSRLVSSSKPLQFCHHYYYYYSPAETPNVLVDESSLSAENLPTDIQTLRQKIMDHLPTEHGQRSYLPKLRYELTDEILAQTNLALETIPTVNITETNARTYATVRALQKSVRQKGYRPQTPRNAWQQRLTATAGEEDQAIEIRCQQTR